MFLTKFINEIIQPSEGTAVSMTNIDPSYFNIDTLYRIKADEAYIAGDYVLLENSFTIFTSNYINYNSIVNLKLTKLK